MKICYIADSIEIPPIKGGGIESHIIGISKELVKLNNEIIIINYDKESSSHTYKYKKLKSGIKIYTISHPLLCNIKFSSIIRSNCFSFLVFIAFHKIKDLIDVDILHNQVRGTALSGVLIKKISKINCIYTEHFWDILFSNVKFRKNNRFLHMLGYAFNLILTKLIYSNANHIIFLNHTSKKMAMKRKLINDNPYSIIPNAVDSDFFKPGLKNVKILEKYHIFKPYLLFVGRIEKEKGLIYLLRAFKIIKNQVDLDLVIVGIISSDYYKSIEDLIEKNNLVDRVKFIGNIDRNELRYLYSNCQIFCLPSLYEIMPMVILEAMASGKPIISTKTGGIPEIISNNINGLLIPPRNHEKLAELIKYLIKEDKTREEMGDFNRKQILEIYNYSTIAKKLNEIYSKFKKI
jgi:glycosyltransferase involved in cell wall biosynthesis